MISFQKNANDALTGMGSHESILPCFRKRSTGISILYTTEASELRLFSRSFFMAGRSGAPSGAPLSFVGGDANPVRPATRISISVVGFGKDLSQRRRAMSEKGVKGEGVSDSYKILTAQQLSITKLACFITTIESLVGSKDHLLLTLDLIDACKGMIRNLDQCTEKLNRIRLSQETGANGARPERTFSPVN
jgi:hypothetical protein